MVLIRHSCALPFMLAAWRWICSAVASRATPFTMASGTENTRFGFLSLSRFNKYMFCYGLLYACLCICNVVCLLLCLVVRPWRDCSQFVARTPHFARQRARIHNSCCDNKRNSTSRFVYPCLWSLRHEQHVFPTLSVVSRSKIRDPFHTERSLVNRFVCNVLLLYHNAFFVTFIFMIWSCFVVLLFVFVCLCCAWCSSVRNMYCPSGKCMHGIAVFGARYSCLHHIAVANVEPYNTVLLSATSAGAFVTFERPNFAS